MHLNTQYMYFYYIVFNIYKNASQLQIHTCLNARQYHGQYYC